MKPNVSPYAPGSDADLPPWRVKPKPRRFPLWGWLMIPLCLGLLGIYFAVVKWAMSGELRVARIDGNEPAAIAACKNHAAAQMTYRRTDHDGDGVLEYAQHLSDFGAPVNLADDDFIEAEVGSGLKPMPKSGYVFKILKQQGPNAVGGRMSYLDGAAGRGNMTHGFALIAFPFQYGETGRLSYMVSHRGTVYGKDLGPDTWRIAEGMSDFNPDPTWQATGGG